MDTFLLKAMEGFSEVFIKQCAGNSEIFLKQKCLLTSLEKLEKSPRGNKFQEK